MVSVSAHGTHSPRRGSGVAWLVTCGAEAVLVNSSPSFAATSCSATVRPACGAQYPPGSWILAPQAGLTVALHDVAAKLGLEFTSTASAPQVASHATPLPRLGLWVPWADTDTIGWARYSLDQRHIPYIYVRDEDIRAGKLRHRYDVLLY